MTKVLLLVHGMGEFSKTWSTSITTKLDEVAAQYPAFKGQKKFSERLRVREIWYDGVFANIVGQWQQDATALDEWTRAANMPLPKLVSWLRKPLPTEAKGFFWTAAIDPLLYRGFQLVRDNVRAQVTAQIAQIAKEEAELAQKSGDAGGLEISVVAHSLGTAVMHDALDILGREPYKGNEVLTAKRFKFTNLFMLADVCLLARKLVADIDYFNSVVRPISAGTADDTYCHFFLNAWHRYDPFVFLAPFRPTTWGPDYIELGPLDHWHQANVHSFTHYLDHPRVHAPIINGALGLPLITDTDYATVLGVYKQTPASGCLAEIAAVQQKAQQLTQATDLEEIIIGISEFLATAQQAGRTCPELR
jgi:hypothetical protein